MEKCNNIDDIQAEYLVWEISFIFKKNYNEIRKI